MCNTDCKTVQYNFFENAFLLDYPTKERSVTLPTCHNTRIKSSLPGTSNNKGFLILYFPAILKLRVYINIRSIQSLIIIQIQPENYNDVKRMYSYCMHYLNNIFPSPKTTMPFKNI